MGIIKKCIEAIKCKCSCAYNEDFCPDRFNTQIETIKLKTNTIIINTQLIIYNKTI